MDVWDSLDESEISRPEILFQSAPGCSTLGNFIDTDGCTRNAERMVCVRKEDVRMVLKELDPAGVSVRGARRLRQHNYIAKGLGVSPTKDFQSQIAIFES